MLKKENHLFFRGKKRFKIETLFLLFFSLHNCITWLLTNTFYYPYPTKKKKVYHQFPLRKKKKRNISFNRVPFQNSNKMIEILKTIILNLNFIQIILNKLNFSQNGYWFFFNKLKVYQYYMYWLFKKIFFIFFFL